MSASPSPRAWRWVQRIRVDSLVSIYRRFLPYLRPHKLPLGLASLAMLGAVAVELARPFPIKWILDGVLVPREGSGGWFRDHPAATIAIASASILVLATLGGTLRYAYTVVSAQVGRRVVHGLRMDLYRQLLRLSLHFHRRAPSGDLLTRLTGDVSMVKEALVGSLLSSLERVLLLVGSVTIMFILEWRLALIGSLTIPLLLFTVLVFNDPMRRAVAKARKGEGRVASSAAMALSGIEVVQAFDAEDEEMERLAKSSRKDLREGVKAARLVSRLSRNVEILIAAMTCVVLGVGAHFVLAETDPMSVGTLIVFLSYLRGMYKPVRAVARQATRLSKASVCADRILEVIDEEPQVRNIEGAVLAPSFQGGVCFERVTFGYGPELETLRDVSFEIPAGSLVALVGPSGAGKSTLARLVPRFYEPRRGRVLIDNADVRSFTLSSLRRQIAFSIQDAAIFGISVRENIALGNPEASDEEVRRAAQVAGADGFIERLPDGYDTVVGERGATLSGGERRRLDLARIALSRAPIVILDEPTTGLDAAWESAVLDALGRTIAGRTTLLISHRMALVEKADLIAVLDGGRLIELGTHAELYEARGAYRALFDLHRDPSVLEPGSPTLAERRR